MDLRDVKEFVKDFIKYIIVIIVVLIIFTYVISIQQVIGKSMEPNFYQNDIVLISKLNYKIHDIKRKDVVVFEYNEYKNLIKRVIGLPGDKIEYKNNTLYINDKAYKEDYINTKTDDFSLKDLEYNTIPDDMYLVLGDNRENSLDSRNFGLIKKEQVIGKVVLRFWPLNRLKIIK